MEPTLEDKTNTVISLRSRHTILKHCARQQQQQKCGPPGINSPSGGSKSRTTIMLSITSDSEGHTYHTYTKMSQHISTVRHSLPASKPTSRTSSQYSRCPGCRALLNPTLLILLCTTHAQGPTHGGKRNQFLRPTTGCAIFPL